MNQVKLKDGSGRRNLWVTVGKINVATACSKLNMQTLFVLNQSWARDDTKECTVWDVEYAIRDYLKDQGTPAVS